MFASNSGFTSFYKVRLPNLFLSLACTYYALFDQLFRQLRESENGQLIVGLCFALLGLYITFIISAHSTTVPDLCVMASALLQYFFLAAFLIMAAEAINLYMKLVIVLGSGFQHYTLKAMIVSWGKFDELKCLHVDHLIVNYLVTYFLNNYYMIGETEGANIYANVYNYLKC